MKTYDELKKENELLKMEIEGLLAEQHPVRTYFDDVLEHPEVMSNKEVAAEYGLCPCEFYELLVEEGIVKDEMITPPFRCFTFYDGGWTQTGRLFLYGMLREMGILPLVESWMKVEEKDEDEEDEGWDEEEDEEDGDDEDWDEEEDEDWEEDEEEDE